MNIFKTELNGGMPMKLDDFRWMDSGYREAFSGLLSVLGASTGVVILSGCARSIVSSTVSITAGFVSISGEVCYVPAHSYAINTFEQWQIVNSFDSGGSKAFQSGVTQETHQKRIAQVVPSPSATVGLVTYQNSIPAFVAIREGIDLNSWQTLYTQTIAPGGSINAGTYTISYKIDSAGFVHFRGQFPYEDPGTGAINILIGTLPVGARPSQLMRYTVSTGMAVGGAMFFSQIEISTNGEVRLRSSSGAYVVYCEMAQIAPFEAI